MIKTIFILNIEYGVCLGIDEKILSKLSSKINLQVVL